MIGACWTSRVVTLWPHADRFSVARGGPGGLCVGASEVAGITVFQHLAWLCHLKL